MPCPPYLISFEGSGNTYTRLLIELTTNYYTGSVHHIDKNLFQAGFKGDGRCDDSVVVLKAHAWVFTRRLWHEFINGTTKECKKLKHPAYISRCNHRDDHLHAIFLVRNPWQAFFSEFQRISFSQILPEQNNSHVYHILLNEFDVVQFKNYLYNFARKYIEILLVYEQFKQMNRTTLLILFEHLPFEITKIVEFLIGEDHFKANAMAYQRRMDCIQQAVSLPREKYIKRPHLKKLNDTHTYLTREMAYAQVNRTTICQIWSILSPHIEKMGLIRWGYGELPNQYNCTSYHFSTPRRRYPWERSIRHPKKSGNFSKKRKKE